MFSIYFANSDGDDNGSDDGGDPGYEYGGYDTDPAVEQENIPAEDDEVGDSS
jgi:hypothetical protein